MATESDNPQKSSILGTAGSKWIQSLLGLLRSRLELFLFELEEQKVRLVELLIWLVCLVIFGLIFLGVSSAAIIFLLPADWRGVGLLVLALIYGFIVCVSLLRIRSMVTQESSIFKESLAQLKKDQACFSDRK
ncbi:MAG: hypothetical protein HOH33_17080 [Verrucomicrobia bacterium]|jgi:uncharacterized membrane protein YqjE|nr:hypothetical protein [Verrucomicrobiota bacterium]